MIKTALFLITLFISGSINAQELNARVTVNSTRIGNLVPRNTFVTLQNALNTFLNTRKWTGDIYAPSEKIDCNFLLNLDMGEEINTYKAVLTIQAARPVFNSSYVSPLINFQDDNVIFKYVEFQQLEFNENRVTGSDALVSNLTAIFAYYANMILAFDNASFAPKGGEPYFQKAQNIVNNAPDGRGILGWKAFDGNRNRYWLAENMLNARYTIMHDVYYNYYRLGMDKLYEDDRTARAEMINVLNLMAIFNTENPNTMINQFFFQGKSTELIGVFKKATPPEKARVRDILPKIDITNATKYQEELK